MWTVTGGHSDVEHIGEFRDRWEYVSGKVGRPNIMTFSNNKGRYFTDTDGTKIWLPEGQELDDYLFLSDHNRSSLPLRPERIGTNKRMINGGMRSYHIVDKMTTTVSWTDLPSRAYSTLAGYAAWKQNPVACTKFTVDGGAGGVEMMRWWESHHGSFWVFFSFDAVPVPLLNNATVFQGYGRVYEMTLTEFDYEATKRGHGMVSDNGLETYFLDLWEVSLTLEEV